VRDGFACVELAPSPKVQLRAAMLPSASELPSVKAHVSPVQVCVKAATGGLFGVAGALTVMLTRSRAVCQESSVMPSVTT
jgi:hypothetical protein